MKPAKAGPALHPVPFYQQASFCTCGPAAARTGALHAACRRTTCEMQLKMQCNAIYATCEQVLDKLRKGLHIGLHACQNEAAQKL